MLSIQKNIQLAPYTTYKLGGPADYFISVQTEQELINALLFAHDKNIEYFILGTGANILISDEGFRGIVIHNNMRTISFKNNTVICESGVHIKDIISESLKRSLSGFEFFSGIPSTVGGALWQNLHFLDLSEKNNETRYIAEIFKSAKIYDSLTEKEIILSNADFKFGYDTSILHSNKSFIVTSASFLLKNKPKGLIKETISKTIDWRTEKHPPYKKEYSCGSVFKKIQGIGAGRLIDQCGLKGYTHKGVTISEKHANFFIHHGEGTATAVKELINYVQEVVYQKKEYRLETEIGFIGF